jgi:hypothetical protein
MHMDIIIEWLNVLNAKATHCDGVNNYKNVLEGGQVFIVACVYHHVKMVRNYQYF